MRSKKDGTRGIAHLTEIGAPDDVEAPAEAHWWKRSKVLGVWICVANHRCDSVRDKHGNAIKSEEQLEAM